MLVVQNSLFGLRGGNTAKKTDSDPQKSKLTPRRGNSNVLA